MKNVLVEGVSPSVIYTARFSREVLDALVETWNRNDVRGHQDERLRLELDFHGLDGVTFLVSAEYPKQDA